VGFVGVDERDAPLVAIDPGRPFGVVELLDGRDAKLRHGREVMDRRSWLQTAAVKSLRHEIRRVEPMHAVAL
jgi:hypothetical protein